MRALSPTPLVAILRGVKPVDAEAIASVIVAAGFGAIEVPLNSPDPLRSIETIARKWGNSTLVGAGAVLTPAEVDAVAGAKLVAAPNADPAVIERAAKLGLTVLPGVATPTEAFAALRVGPRVSSSFRPKACRPRS
jgi:2-dehydro-3-deoxyphosphogalactonate aldolase